MRLRFVLMSVLFVMQACIQPALAQSVGSSFSGIGLELPVIYVADESGRETAGRLVTLTDTSLVIDTGAEHQRFEAAEVTRIQRAGDSLKSGVIVGALIGGPIGLTISLRDGGCGSVRTGSAPFIFVQRTSCPGAQTAMFLTCAALGSAVGTAFDAAVAGRAVLWEAPKSRDGPNTAASLEVVGFGLSTWYVVDHAGRETAGKMVSLTDSSVILAIGTGHQTFTPEQVTRIERRGDSLRDGAIKGTITGAALGVSVMLAALATVGGSTSGPERTAAFLGAGALFAGLGAAVGTALDALRTGRTLLWEAPGAASGTATFGIAAQPSGVMAIATIRW